MPPTLDPIIITEEIKKTVLQVGKGLPVQPLSRCRLSFKLKASVDDPDQDPLAFQEGSPSGRSRRGPQPMKLVSEDSNLEVTIGRGMLVVGLEKALLTMVQGEIAKISLAPEAGYGAADLSVSRIAPNSYLEYEVELKAVVHAIDVSLYQDRSVLKYIVVHCPDPKAQRPQFEDIVTVQNQTIDPLTMKPQQRTSQTFEVGGVDSPMWQDHIVATLLPNELVNIVTSHDGNATMTVLKEIRRPGSESYGLEGVRKRLEDGRKLFQGKIFPKAYAKFNKAFDIVLQLGGGNVSQSAKWDARLVHVAVEALQESARAYLYNGENQLAAEMATRCVQVAGPRDPPVDSYFYRAQAFRLMNRFDEAQRDLDALSNHTLSPDLDAAVRDEERRLIAAVEAGM